MAKHKGFVGLFVIVATLLMAGNVLDIHPGADQVQVAAASNISDPDPHNVAQQSDTAHIQFFNAAGATMNVFEIDPADVLKISFDERIIPFMAVGFRGSTGSLPFPSGEHRIQLFSESEGTQTAVMDPVTMTFEAGRRYVVVIMGHIEDASVHLVQIDETELIEQIDLTQQAFDIVVHNIQEGPPLDFYFDSELMASDVPYGGYATYPHNVSVYIRIRVTVAGDPDEVILSTGDTLQPDIGWLVMFYGSYPGMASVDFRYTPIPFFIGELTQEHHGLVNVGDEIDVNLTAIGSRVRYDLVLGQDTTLDIYLMQDSSVMGDPFLWLYDEQGDFLYANDEISFTEDDNPNAGFEHLALPAGSYILEIGSYLDISPGPFILSVMEAEEY